MRSAIKSPTSRRLVIYLTGVAIGCLLLGMFTMRRNREAAERAAREAEARARETPETRPTGADGLSQTP